MFNKTYFHTNYSITFQLNETGNLTGTLTVESSQSAFLFHGLHAADGAGTKITFIVDWIHPLVDGTCYSAFAGEIRNLQQDSFSMELDWLLITENGSLQGFALLHTDPSATDKVSPVPFPKSLTMDIRKKRNPIASHNVILPAP
ncbi:hypothetical protein [Ohtaekwangia koreensis]|uniref:Uncharacterized protein n=1 Tax=Ohtaekwangia koreensis TaxID=688867 RepID=A0A1T5M6B6_9BACT|nr:hypothetical protein [Ohtaekwangia koreensis]SKC83378.1 hypothetical protein SAMN05660236_4435 [Ohtaekwangia koreensis]